jgi:hypothetical protein
MHIYPKTHEKGMKRPAVAGIILLCLVASISIAVPAAADKCGIPLDLNVEFDESAQNAIVAWNGEKECLILSTDLQSSSPGRLMEMLPLPSAPYDIQTGNTGSFKTLIDLYNEKMRRLDIDPSSSNREKTPSLGGDSVEEFRGIEIVFSSSVGLHNITVIKITNQTHFLQWAQSFAASQGVSNISINERLNYSVGDHLLRGISYFVFDTVNVTGEKKTAEPLAYLFNTTYLYYPLRITYDSLPPGRTAPNDISVFFVADGVLARSGSYLGGEAFSGVHYTGGVNEYIEFSKSDLGRVFGPLGALFNRSAFVSHLSGSMYFHEYSYGSVQDIVLGRDDFYRPTDSEMRKLYERADFLRTIKPLSGSLAYYILRSSFEPGYAPPAFWLALITLGIFLGPVAIGLMFKGIIERGSRRRGVFLVWLYLYLVGVAGILWIDSSVSRYSGSGPWSLAPFLALCLPLFAVLYMGERFKTRPAIRKHTVSAWSFGMATVQVLVFVFTPSSMVAVPMSALCFPIVGIASITIIPLALWARRKEQARPGQSPPPPKDRSPL